jgi:hypothetical protein
MHLIDGGRYAAEIRADYAANAAEEIAEAEESWSEDDR